MVGPLVEELFFGFLNAPLLFNCSLVIILCCVVERKKVRNRGKGDKKKKEKCKNSGIVDER